MQTFRVFVRPLNRRLRLPILAFVHPGNRGARVRSVVRVLRFLARDLAGKTTIVAAGTRSKVIADARETNSPKAVASPIPDQPEMQVWIHRLGDGDLFVDVGANIGLYSIIAAEAGAEVVAIEPDEGSVRRLRENLELNGYTARVVNQPVADVPGEAIVTSGLDSYNHLVLDGGGGDTVQATTLDVLLDGKVVEGMKIDVQGAERLVLQGARQLLAEQRIRCIQIEWNLASRRLLGEPRSVITELLEEHGYRLFRAVEGGGLVPAGTDLGEGKRDMFAMPADA